ncbi:MAG: hypothetical protein ACR2JI_11935 [Mycobacterium sp.]
MTAPLLAPGYLLLRDAVSTPRSYLTDAALGIGESAPRAVPQDFAVATLSVVLDGGLVVKAVLIAALLLAGWGAGRLAGLLLPEVGLPGQLVAATLAVWNPYVAERLLQGHWSLLLGYGALPWVTAVVLRLRSEPSRADWAALVFWMALAGLTPTGLMLAAVVALVCVRRLRSAAAVLGIAVAAALPWLTASLLGTALSTSQSAGLTQFAARAEPGLGTLGSLAGLGGLWNAEAVPPSRTTAFAVLATVVLLAVVALGAVAVVREPAAKPLLILAAAAVLLPAAMATGPGLTALRAIVDALPGLAVLRDGQKWVALAMPGYTVAGAGAVLTLQRWIRPGVSAVVCAAALIAVLPDLAWGVGGRIAPVHYPGAWPVVAAAINAEPRPVVTLPPDSMRQFTWAGPSPVLDPLPRWVRAEVLTTGDLLIGGRTVSGEGAHAREVQRLLASNAGDTTLARAGVGWVLNENSMTLQRIGGATPGAPQWKRTSVIVAHLVWVAMLIGGAIGMARPYCRNLRVMRSA